jgi:hypothetical protein
LELGEQLGRWQSLKATLDGDDWARAKTADPVRMERLEQEWREKYANAMDYELRHGAVSLYPSEHPSNQNLEQFYQDFGRPDPK